MHVFMHEYTALIVRKHHDENRENCLQKTFERLNEYFALRRNGRGEMVKFGNINAYVNHEVVPPFHKV